MKTPKSSTTKHFFIVFASLVLLGLAVALFFFKAKPPLVMAPPVAKTGNASVSVPGAPKKYVGASTCKACHSVEYTAWQNSHHALAMQQANDQSVLGNFDNATFSYFGVESTFFKQEGRFMVRTEGPDGKLANYPVVYTFGVTPLQQYLIAFPSGRYQALSIAWDSRPKTEGGQRWFHLYPDEEIDHFNQLHWTGRYQNWNMQCAECHSTNLRKGYDAATDSYKTIFSEINVACESCHGPASQHVAWAKHARPPYTDADKGLLIILQSHWQDAWTFQDSQDKIAHRNQLANESLMNTCWACHARRSMLVENSTPGLPLEDTHRPALLTQPAYHADGQQRDEDYTWGSFRQSRMYQKGVTCMDCHEPHALKLRAEGNALCARCHSAAIFDTPTHHFHEPGSNGAHCMNCHAPKQNYMLIDGRHDHSFRLPRPDLSNQLEAPNACTLCHRKRKPEWAAEALDKWYGKNWRDRPHYGTVLHAGVTQGSKALPALLELAHDARNPAVIRATAATLAGPLMRPELIDTADQLLMDKDPSVRIAALGLLEAFDAEDRARLASPLLSDAIRGVRIEAARLLADVPDGQFPESQLSLRKSATQEYQQSLSINADWPSENVNQGNFLLRQGQTDAALMAYERALKLDPYFAEAYVNLADAYRQQGRDDEGERQLRQGLALLPDAAGLHHALGLALVRQGNLPKALQELGIAARLDPENARYAYVYAVGLHSIGNVQEALAVLDQMASRQPYDLDVLSGLISMYQERGDRHKALVYAKKAAEALPNDAAIKQLLKNLESEQ